MRTQQAKLESLLTEVARICVLEDDLAGIIPAGSSAKLLDGKYRETYNENTAPIFLNSNGEIKIYKKAELVGKGTVVLSDRMIEETLKLADEYVAKTKNHSFVYSIYPKFDSDCNAKYPERIAQIWNNIDWEFLPKMIDNTIAHDLSDHVTLAVLGLEYKKYACKIILLSRI